MKRRQPQSIGDLLRSYLRQEGLETPLQQRQALDAFKTVIGPSLAVSVTNLFIRNQTLVVFISRPALRQNLMYQRSRLVNEINAIVGAQIITSIELH